MYLQRMSASPGIDYSTPGPLTDLGSVHRSVLEGLATDPVDICWPVHGLVIQPSDIADLGVSFTRLAEKNLRPVASIVAALLALDPAPLVVERPASRRVIGTCRHFAVLSCALLRHRGISARVRCGFGTYFQPGQALDHWITEYRTEDAGRWIRIDTEILGAEVLSTPTCLTPEQFLSGGEAWAAYRGSSVDASTFGVYGTANFGPNEIRGNAIKDLAALNKVEMLPWDEWGPMPAIYRDEALPDVDMLLDEIAVVSAADDPRAIADLYYSGDLRAPVDMLS